MKKLIPLPNKTLMDCVIYGRVFWYLGFWLVQTWLFHCGLHF